MQDNNQLSMAFEAVSILQLAHELGYAELKEGAGQKSPFRDDHKAGSFSLQRDYFKDHAHDEHKGGHIAFVQFARPQWSKRQCIEFIIRAAGMEPEKLTRGQVKREVREKRGELYRKQSLVVSEIPPLGMAEPGPMSAELRGRWNEGQAAIQPKLAELAAGRGWGEEVMRAMVGQNKTSMPLLPWVDSGERRMWAWMVEKPIFDRGRVGLVPVGFHGRYDVFPKDAPPERRWCFVPYLPATTGADGSPKHLSGFQQHLVALKSKTPAYPFVLGDLAEPRLVVMLEGQFDAISFAAAFGWLAGGFPRGVSVFGLRGVQSQVPVLSAYGRHFAKHRPMIWIIGDNDKAGRLIDAKNPEENNHILREPSFVDRLRAQGCTVRAELIGHPGCKDFNDVYKAARPPIETMAAWAQSRGAGDLIK